MNNYRIINNRIGNFPVKNAEYRKEAGARKGSVPRFGIIRDLCLYGVFYFAYRVQRILCEAADGF